MHKVFRSADVADVANIARAVIALLFIGSFAFADEAGESVDFARDIRPILSDRCFFCHGPDEADRQADLRLDEEEAAKEYAIVPGDVEASELIARILSDDEDEQMGLPIAIHSFAALRWI